jgi:D-alanyl-D-alanine carboxypeptidase
MIYPQRYLFTFAAFALLSLSACGSGDAVGPGFSEDTIRQLDSTIATRMQTDNLPGVVVGVWVPGRGEYVVARGKANLDTGAARTVDAPFRIASVTKTFTATAILQLADAGKLSTSDRLSKWFPNFPNADKTTVDDLLRMRSGIPDPMDKPLLEYYYQHPDNTLNAVEMIRRAAARADEFKPPNEKTIYANINYMLLEEIIKKVSGNDIGVQITEKIIKPLGLKYSLYPTNNRLPGGVRGYCWDTTSKKFVDRTVLNTALAGGAGAMISTLADLKIYAKALCTGVLLKPQTQKTRLEGQPLSGSADIVRYGEGIVRIGKFCGHNGAILGFSSEMWYLPEKDAVIIINVNRMDTEDKSQSSDLFFAITKILFPDDVNW